MKTGKNKISLIDLRIENLVTIKELKFRFPLLFSKMISQKSRPGSNVKLYK